MRVVFFGTGAIGWPTLKALLEDATYEVDAIFTQPDRPAGRERKLRSSPIKDAVAGKKIPLYQPERIRESESLAILEGLSPDVIVVAAYGQILPASILQLPKYGCLNIHASLLPRHRGASPINAAILSGDEKSGITIMQMDEGLDTGAIWIQSALSIGPRETAGQLHDRLGELAPEALFRTLDLVRRGEKPVAQEDGLATHAPKLKREDGALDWMRSARELDWQIRGLTPWPGAYTAWPGEGTLALKIHQAEVVKEASGAPGSILDLADGILVAAGEGALRLQEVQLAGGKRLQVEDFLRGNSLRVGQSFLQH